MSQLNFFSFLCHTHDSIGVIGISIRNQIFLRNNLTCCENSDPSKTNFCFYEIEIVKLIDLNLFLLVSLKWEDTGTTCYRCFDQFFHKEHFGKKSTFLLSLGSQNWTRVTGKRNSICQWNFSLFHFLCFSLFPLSFRWLRTSDVKQRHQRERERERWNPELLLHLLGY